MNIKAALKIAIPIVLSANATRGIAQDLRLERRDGFISPLALRLFVPASDWLQPQMCRRLKCPPLLNAAQIGGALPTIDPPLTADLPNVRVSFVVQHVSHEAVAGGGVDGDVLLGWRTDSAAASVQNGGPYQILLPAAGETFSFSVLVYDALVYGACNSFSAFPVTHAATVTGDDLTVIGSFDATDDSTLDATGFYNLSYTVVAVDGAAVSHIHVSGKVNAICSGANSL